MSKKKDRDVEGNDEPTVPMQPLSGAHAEADDVLTTTVAKPYIATMALTVVYSNGQGEVMYAAAQDERGIQIQIENFKRVMG